MNFCIKICTSHHAHIIHHLFSVFPDINECDEGKHSCVENATCVNSFGSYSCVCDVGLVGNGKVNCFGKSNRRNCFKIMIQCMTFSTESGDVCAEDMLIDVVLILQTDDEASLEVLQNFASYVASKFFISEDQVQVSRIFFLFIEFSLENVY